MTHALDAPTVRRTSTVRFELVDDAHATIGEVHPDRSPPAISVSTTRAVQRQMTGLRLPAGEANSINPVTDRVRAVLEVAGVGEGPLGVFVFDDAPVVERGVRRSGRDRMLAGSLSDTLALLNVPLTRSLSLPAGAMLDSAIGAIIGDRVVYSNDLTGRTIGDAPVTWLRGSTTKLAVLADVARLAGLGAPYADNTGVVRIDTTGDADASEPVVSYRNGRNIQAGSLVTAVDPQAPNEFQVTDSSVSTEPLSVSFHVPDDAPHSAVNRGYTILEAITVQSVAGVSRAAAIAYQAYQAAQAAYEVFFFNGPADWRHDTLSVVRVNGVTCRELSWSMSCGPGMTMSHECARVYA